MAVLFITHDLGIVRKTAERVCVMRQGRIVEQGAVSDVFADPQHPYTRELLAAEATSDAASLQAGAPAVIRADDLKVRLTVRRGSLRCTVGHLQAVARMSHAVRQG